MRTKALIAGAVVLALLVGIGVGYSVAGSSAQTEDLEREVGELKGALSDARAEANQARSDLSAAESEVDKLSSWVDI